MSPKDAEELVKRKAQLAARDGKPGFKANCAELRKRISELESKDAPDPGDA